MSIHKKKSVALKAAANAIRQSTGYGGLERVIAISQRSSTPGPNKSLSKFDKIKDPSIKHFAEIMIDNIDGALTGKEIIEEIEKYTSGTDDDSAPIFNAHFDLYTEDGKSVKDNKGTRIKTSDIASTIGKKSKSRSLTIINSKHFDFSPATSFLSEIEIFANAIPTTELSKCVPYLDVLFQTGTDTDDSGKSLTSISLARYILGPGKASDNDSLLASATPINDKELAKKTKSSFGMELFTAPQTLVSTNLGRDIPILDQFRPFMSLESFDVSIVPVAGLMEKKTASMKLILHDRSRLHEIADLVRPENYGTNKVIVEWGWSHPDSDGKNQYGKFLNAMRERETFGVYNSRFNLGADGQVNIDLDLAALGSFESQSANVLVNPDYKSHTKGLSDLTEEIKKIIKAETKEKGKAMIAPVVELQSHLSNSGLFDITELRKVIDKIKTKNEKVNASEKISVKEIQEAINKLTLKLTAYGEDKKKLFDKIQQKLGDSADPFLYNNEKNVYSLGKIFSTFVGRPLLASDKFSEVQMFFYGFGSESGHNGALASYSIAEFQIKRDEFHKALSFMADSLRTPEIPINVFVQFIIKNFIKYPDSPLSKMTNAAFITSTLERTGRKPTLPPAAADADDAIVKFKQKQVDAHSALLKTFRVPKVTVKYESHPSLTNPNKTILKVHVFDVNCGRHDSFTKVVAAAGGGLETIKAIGNKTIEFSRAKNKESTDLTDQEKALKNLLKEIQDKNETWVKKIKSSNPEEWKISIPFQELKKLLAQNYPTLVYGSENSIFISAKFGSVQNAGFKNLQLSRYGQDPQRTAAGTSPNGLPIKIQPTDMDMTILGCPLLKYANHFFVDFGTGTSADDMYYAKTITHSLRPGSFTTSVKMSTRDADGKFESAIHTLNRASQLLAPDDKGADKKKE
jgi:hypothetical protein